MRAKHWIGCLLGTVAVGGALILALTGEPAEAGFTSAKTKELVAYVKSDAPWNLRLVALGAMTKKKESGIEGELGTIAKGSDKKLAVFAATALGKRKTSDAKKRLQSLLEDAKVDVNVRIAALSAIAYHWKEAGDLPYLESKTKKNDKLWSQYKRLKRMVYGK